MTDSSPSSLSTELIGHTSQQQLLREAFDSGRFHHGWLLSGESGIGKATFALQAARHLFAQSSSESQRESLLKEEPQDLLFGAPDATDQDSEATTRDNSLTFDKPGSEIDALITNNSHPDLKIVQRPVDEKTGVQKKEITVEQIRAVTQFLSLTPSMGGWRLVIIDKADHMNRNAANALLKALEEPPDQAILFLACDCPGKLLPTLRSRCQHLPFQPLDTSGMREFLVGHGLNLSPEDETLALQLSGGAPGTLLNLIEAGGLELYRQLLSMLTTYPAIDMATVLKLSEQLARKDQAPLWRQFQTLFVGLLQRCLKEMTISGGASAESRYVLSASEQAVTRALAQHFSPQGLISVLQSFLQLSQEAERLNMDKKQTLLNQFFVLAQKATVS